MMYKIQANQSGTRSIEVNSTHLETLDRYRLLANLVDSNGIVDESVLEKLRFNIRSILETEGGQEKALLDLCLDVVYNSNMKALGLQNLVILYQDWKEKQIASQTAGTE